MKKIRCFIMLCTAALLMSVCSVINVFAVGEAQFSIPSTAVGVGGEFNVSITFMGSENIGKVNTSVSYDSRLLTFVSGNNVSGGSGILEINGHADGKSSELTVDMTFRAQAEGVANFNLVNCSILASDGRQIGSPTAYASVTVSGVAPATSTTVTTMPPSDESDTDITTTTTSVTTAKPVETGEDGIPVEGVLRSLTVDHGTLVPEFVYNVYNYTVKVPYSVDNVEIEGKTNEITDYIWYTGNSECQVGNNIRTITVTDTSGRETKYTINVVRAQADESESESNTAGVISRTDTSNVSSTAVAEDGMEIYRKLLNPALAIVLVVLVIALVVIIIWIKSKFFKKNDKKKGKTAKSTAGTKVKNKSAQKKRQKIKMSKSGKNSR